MHIEFKSLCNASKHMNMHISNAINQKFISLLPLLVCFSCPRILILLNSSMLLPLYPCPCSTSFISLYNLSPFIINFHKRYASYWCKGMHFGVDGWDLHFWWTLLEYWNDTICRYHLEFATCTTCILSFLCMGHPFYTLKFL